MLRQFVVDNSVSLLIVVSVFSLLNVLVISYLLWRIDVLCRRFNLLVDCVSYQDNYIKNNLIPEVLSSKTEINGLRVSVLTLDREMNPGSVGADPCRCVFCRAASSIKSDAGRSAKEPGNANA